MSTTGTQAIDRAAQLLTLVVRSDDPVSFTELVEDSGLTRSTTSRLLAALEANHLLERDSDGGFSAGALFTHYASKHDGVMLLARIAEPILREVGAETGETVNLAVARGDAVVQIAQVDATFVLGARDWVGVDVPPHCSALGKVLYAFDALDVPSGHIEQLTEHSLASATALRKQLRAIRREGFATTRNELEIGLSAAAAPVLDDDGTAVAALGVSGPTSRLEPQLAELGRLLTKHAAALAQLLHESTHGTRTEGVA